MINLRFDAQGSLDLRWPETPPETLELARLYIAKERSLPEPERRTQPSLERVEGLRRSAAEAAERAAASELDRASAAETLAGVLAEVKEPLREAILQLKAKYSKNRARLPEWGVQVKQGARGLSVLTPKTDVEWIDLLLAYATKESSLPEADRITAVPLEPLLARATAAREAREGRTSGATGRAEAIARRDEAVAALRTALQVAAVCLLEARFGMRVDRGLAEWGYAVVEDAPAPPKPEPAAPPA